MISALRNSAKPSASAVFPEPVGPVRITASLKSAGDAGMPIFEYTTKLDVPVERAFDFIARPRNLLLISPPTPTIEILEAPERLALGSRFTVRLTHLGFQQQLTSEVTWFEGNVGFTDEQVEGPFTQWSHTHRLTTEGSGTSMLDRIEFEAPRGMLGWVLTNGRVENGLAAAFSFRDSIFRRLLQT